jgi:prepilin-type N-terminal cleavage/methylation domain-containing protein/prepilin-type processing-associated H-X9-DG protein
MTKRTPFRRGFTLMELLVVIAIIIILIGLLLPAVQKVREAAASRSCRYNLKQLGQAVRNYHEVNGVLPPGYVSSNPGIPDSTDWCQTGGVQGAPWTVLILPHAEQEDLFKQFDLTVPFQDTSNQMAAPNDAAVVPLKVLSCPSDARLSANPLWSSYFGVQGGGAAPDCGNSGCGPANERAMYVSGVLYSGSHHRLTDVEDGVANVFMIGESRYGGAAWGASAKQDSCAYARNLAGAQDQINLYATQGVHDTRGFSSYHTGGAHFSMCDGSVQFISENINLTTYRQLGRRADGLPEGGLR